MQTETQTPTTSACAHYCPQCRKAHSHSNECAYIGAPQVCPTCYLKYIARLQKQTF